MKKILIIIFAVILIFPNMAFGQELTLINYYVDNCQRGRFIPCDGTDACPCNFAAFRTLIMNILNFLVEVSFPLAVITFSWAGFKFMIDRGKGKDATEAKNMMVKVVIGFVFILAAWAIVRTVMQVLLDESILQRVFQ